MTTSCQGKENRQKHGGSFVENIVIYNVVCSVFNYQYVASSIVLVKEVNFSHFLEKFAPRALREKAFLYFLMIYIACSFLTSPSLTMFFSQIDAA